MKDIEQIIADEIEASEQAEADATVNGGRHAHLPEGTVVTRGHGRSKTLQVRLNEDEYEALEHLAKVRELPVSTVARTLLLSHLRTDRDQGRLFDEIEVLLQTARRWVSEHRAS